MPIRPRWTAGCGAASGGGGVRRRDRLAAGTDRAGGVAAAGRGGAVPGAVGRREHADVAAAAAEHPPGHAADAGRRTGRLALPARPGPDGGGRVPVRPADLELLPGLTTRTHPRPLAARSRGGWDIRDRWDSSLGGRWHIGYVRRY